MLTILEKANIFWNNHGHELFCVNVPGLNGRTHHVNLPGLPKIREAKKDPRSGNKVDDPWGNHDMDFVGVPGSAHRVAFYTRQNEMGLNLYDNEETETKTEDE